MLKPFPKEYRHGLSLSLDYVANRLPHVLIFEQPSSTAMPRPPFSIRPIVPKAIQFTTGVRLELNDNLLGRDIGFQDCMHVISPHMCRKQIPSAILAVLPDRPQNGRPAFVIEEIGRLKHSFAFRQSALWIGLYKAAAEMIVGPVHGARFIAVEVGAVARERNEVPQAMI